MNSSLTSLFTMLALTFWMGIPWEAWPFPPRCVTLGSSGCRGGTLPWHTHTSPFPFHPSLPSWLSLTLNISLFLVPVLITFIFSLKYTDCQHLKSNQREMDIFTLHLNSIFPAWFVLLGSFFPSHDPFCNVFLLSPAPSVYLTLHFLCSIPSCFKLPSWFSLAVYS